MKHLALLILLFLTSCDRQSFKTDETDVGSENNPISIDTPTTTATSSTQTLSTTSTATQTATQTLSATSTATSTTPSTQTNSTTTTETATQTATQTATNNLWVGLYNNKIKSSANDSYDDIETTVASLEELGVTLYGYDIVDGDLSATCSLTYDSAGKAARDYTTAGFEWCHFLELLEATKNTSIKIFAVLKEKHLNKSNRWLAADFFYDYNKDGSCSEFSDYTSSATCNALESDATKEAWLNAFVDAAKTLSTLSVTYPNLVGFTVDDFDVYVCHPTNTKYCYSVTEVTEITTAAHSGNSSFAFWPTMYQTTGVPKVIADGFVIGSRYGAKRKAGDYAQMTLTLKLATKPNEATVEFLWSDNNAKEKSSWSTYEVDKRFIVNGTTIIDAALWENDYIEKVSEDVSSYLTSGENTIVWQTYFKTGLNAFHSALVYGSGLSVKINGEEITCSTTSTTCTLSFESLNQNASNESLYAETNADYRITEAVDGVVAVYQPATEAIDSDLISSVLESARTNLGTKKLLHVSYAALWGHAIKSDYLKDQLDIAVQIADGVLLWNPPLALTQPEKGIFAYRDSEYAGYELYSFWPQKMPGTFGWYQKFTSKNLLSGTITVDVIDNQTSSTSYFQKTITDSLGNSYYEEDCSNNAGAVESISLNLSTPAQLVLKVKETAGVGDVNNKVWFHVVDSAGNTLTASDFDFESTSDDTDTQNINTMLKSTLPTLSAE